MLSPKIKEHATKRQKTVGSFAVIGAALFIFGIYLPYFGADGYGDYIAIRDGGNAIFRTVSAAGVLLLMVSSVAAIYVFHRKNLLAHFGFPVALFLMFAINALIQSEAALFYEGLAISAIFFSASVISLNTSGIFGVRPVGATIGWILILILVSFLVVHGFPENRWVGGVHPNLFGATALSALILHSTATGCVSRKIAIATLCATLIVSSRGSLAATLVFLVSYILFFGKLRCIKKSAANMAAATMLVIVIILMLVWNSSSVEEFLVETTAINDPSRGLDSGFTGRAEYWPLVTNLILDRPFWGNAQAADGVLIHSGLLDAALRLGFLPIVLFVFSAAFMFGRKMVTAGPQVKMASIGGLVLLSYSVLEESLFAVFNIQALSLYACISIAVGCAASSARQSAHVQAGPRRTKTIPAAESIKRTI
ncbi:MAG: O-antigen ligase family protein [Algiphilus sp.]|uniref:O-antigen ligase family protein n=1 Tax=Algiphilus sp. TaxID=1872431 RepID=UPI002A66E601|nr:O-antigen ligase family protein [Pseudomonadota bacterium]